MPGVLAIKSITRAIQSSLMVVPGISFQMCVCVCGRGSRGVIDVNLGVPAKGLRTTTVAYKRIKCSFFLILFHPLINVRESNLSNCMTQFVSSQSTSSYASLY